MRASSVVPTVQVLDYLRSRSADMFDLLQQLVEIETPSVRPESHEPIFELLGIEFGARGYRLHRAAGTTTGGFAMAVPIERLHKHPVQLMIGHVDTVWPAGTLAARPLEIAGDRIYGPGIYDMKAGIVQIIFAVEALAHFAQQPPATPVALVNSDEEIGSRESTATIRRLSRIASRVFVMEPGLGPSGKLKTARKGLGRYRIDVKGVAAHAGLDPERGASAILELSSVIQRLFALNDPYRGISVNVGTIEGGLRPNVIAPESSAVVDVRVLHPEDAEAVDAAIRSLAATTEGTAVSATGGFGRPPMERTPGNVALFEKAREIGREIGMHLEDGTAGGGSDGNTTSLHAPTLDGLGATGDGAHAPGEHMLMPSLTERTALLAKLLLSPIDEAEGGA